MQSLARRWTEEEETRDYQPHNGSWPPRAQQGLKGDIPGLESDLKRCGGIENDDCQRIAFRLGIAFLGGTLFGHRSDGDREEEEIHKGAAIMQQLADRGSPEGACGWAFCLASGEGVEEDSALAAHYHRQAAASGYAQSMHELGTMHYLGAAKAARRRCQLNLHTSAHSYTNTHAFHAPLTGVPHPLTLAARACLSQATDCRKTARRRCTGSGGQLCAAAPPPCTFLASASSKASARNRISLPLLAGSRLRGILATAEHAYAYSLSTPRRATKASG